MSNFDRRSFNKAVQVVVWIFVGLAYIIVCSVLSVREPWIGVPALVLGLFAALVAYVYVTMRARK